MKTIALLALAALCAAPARAAVKNSDTLLYGNISDIDSLDPAWAYDTASQNVISNVYEFLFGFKKGSLRELEPRLAAKVPSQANGLVSSDGLTYRIPIRKGVKFHDGSTMTAEDVRFSLLRFMLMDRDGGPSALLLQPILGVDSTRGKDGKLLPGLYERAAKAVTVKGDEVVIRLPKRFAPFLSILATWNAVLPKAWCASHGDWDGTAEGLARFNNPSKREDLVLNNREVGTGPFRLAGWDKDSKEVVLERFDGYWRKPARLKRVIIRSIDEFSTRKLMLENGDLDVIYSPLADRDQVEHLPGVQIVDVHPLEAPESLSFNFKINVVGNPYVGSGRLDGDGVPSDFFADLEVRRAFAYSFDYDSYVRDILHGKGEHPAGIIPKGMLGHIDAGPKYSFDLAKAAEHFKAARRGQVWSQGFRFTCLFTTGSQPGEIQCQMLKRNVEGLNPKFKIDVRPLQWSTFLADSTAKKIPLIESDWQADYPDPHNIAFPMMGSEGYYSSHSSYSNPEVDRLIEQAVTTLDTAKREAMYRKLQKIAYEQLPFMITDDAIRYRTQRTWVKGWVYNPVFPDAPYGSDYYDLYKAE